MAKYRILYWHDIPCQVRAEDENGRVNRQLPPRFQQAIDEAAMAAKRVGGDDYTDGFRWSEAQEQEGSAEAVAGAIAGRLDAEYPHIDVQAQVRKLKQDGKG
jgi:hypothetical protein